MARNVYKWAASAGLVLAIKAAAFDSFTLYYDVPNKSGVDPLLQPPTVPGAFTPTGSWNSTLDPSNTLGNGATPPPGLQIAQLQQAFAIKGLTFNAGNTMSSVTISVQSFVRITYGIENIDGELAKTETVTTSGTVTTYALGAVNTTGTSILSLLASTTVPGVAVPADEPGADGSGTDPIGAGADFVSGTTLATPSGSVFSFAPADLAALTGNGFTSLPIKFSPSATSFTDGNVFTSGSTFGYAIVAVTYTYVPEASPVAAGMVLGLGGLGWCLRRRMIGKS